MFVQCVSSGEFVSNSYFVYNNEVSFLIDSNTSAVKSLKTLKEKSIPKPSFIIITHGHFDHFGGAKEIANFLDVDVYMHSADLKISKSANFSIMLLKLNDRIDLPKFIDIGDIVPTLETNGFQVLHCPGHTPGSIVIYGHGLAFVGDLVSSQGFNFNNLPGENRNALLNSFDQLKNLVPANTIIYPGHGAPQSFGRLLSKMQNIRENRNGR